MTGQLACAYENATGLPAPKSLEPEASGLCPELPDLHMSFALTMAIENELAWHNRESGLPAVVKTAAREALETLLPYAEPVDRATVALWIAPILASVKNQRTGEAFAGWFGALMIAVGNLEIGAFTETTQREALGEIEFFPSASEIYGIVAGPAVEIRQRIANLRRIIATKTQGADA